MLAESWKRDVMAFPQVPSLGIEVHASAQRPWHVGSCRKLKMVSFETGCFVNNDAPMNCSFN